MRAVFISPAPRCTSATKPAATATESATTETAATEATPAKSAQSTAMAAPGQGKNEADDAHQ